MAIRIGIMSFAHMHAESYAEQIQSLPGAELAGVADHEPERARTMAARLGVPVFGYETLLRQADVDAVVICSENVRHRELVEMAAAAKKAVLCEKPLATTIEDGEAMLKACRENGVALYTAFPCRFHPAYVRLRQTVHAGELGALIGARSSNHGVNPDGWFTDTKLSGGGAAMDHTVHVADLLRDLSGAEPVEVYAEIGNGIRHGDFDDVAMLTISFDNGLFATLDASWSLPKTFWTWGDVTLYVTGTGGTAGLDMFAQNHQVFSDAALRPRLSNWGDNADRHLVSAFIAALSGEAPPTPLPWGAPPLATGEDGLAAARVAIAAYQSARTGEAVSVRPS